MSHSILYKLLFDKLAQKQKSASVVKFARYAIINLLLGIISKGVIVAEKENLISGYETVIGIEVHVQLTTKSKIFCQCPNIVSHDQNSTICPICAGHPGVLPVLNKEVAERAIMVGLATNCTITEDNFFARKHYFYPDLPKAYQITQSTEPICKNGFLEIPLEDGSFKKIRINRIHMEEDAGKNLHSALTNESYVDLNRAGTPLLEIVTEPDISSPYEARTYLKMMRNIVMYLNVGTANMEEGAFRADTNISVRKPGAPLGTKCELKNINSFKFISDAIEYEVERQVALIENGGKVVQETRLWDTKEHKTVSMRSKEEAADYRYFPDPDLPSLHIDSEWISRVQKDLPELPKQRYQRYIDLGLSAYEADVLVNDKEIAAYYDKVMQFTKSPVAINWVLRELMAFIKDEKITLSECLVTPQLLAELVTLLDDKIINNRAAQEVFEIVAKTGQSPQAVVKEKGLEQIGSSDEIEKIIQEIIASNPHNVAEYKSGKVKLWGFFVGQAMQKTKGKGDPQMINDLLKKYLS